MVLSEVFVNKTKGNVDSTFKFCDAQGTIDMTYDSLYRRALQMKKHLYTNGIGTGDIVLLQAIRPIQFIIGYWGIILNGSVPALYPIGKKIPEHIVSISNLCDEFGIKGIVADDMVLQILKQYDSQFVDERHLVKITTDEYNEAEIIEPVYGKEDNLTMLQFSSGSTGNPKGVMLNSRSICTDVEGLVEHVHLTQKDVFFNWLPLTHDFGIVVMHFAALFSKASQIIMEPTMFLREPMVFADLTDTYKVSVAAFPNFAMNLIIKSYDAERVKGKDLSSLKMIATAGEGISAKTCKTFLSLFAPNGLPDTAIIPAYGLAEAAAAVTCQKRDLPLSICAIDSRHTGMGEKIVFTKGAFAKEIVGCGVELNCNHVHIVDVDGRDCGEDCVGIIKSIGSNNMSGYYMKPEATQSVLDEKQDLDTGDLGFLHEGVLYITGRMKDVIILNGQNYYAVDIESEIMSHVSAESGYIVAAFGVNNQTSGQEELYIAMECVKEEKDRLAEEIKKFLGTKMFLQPKEIIWQEELPKTNSGKVQYFKLKESVEEQRESVSTEDTVKALVSLVEMEIGEKVYEKDYETAFVELGIDSLMTMHLFGEIEACFGIKLSIDIIWSHPNIKELAGYIAENAEKLSIKESAAETMQEEIEQSEREEGQTSEEDIAIISMACHFPGQADNPEKYWQNLLAGKDCITSVDKKRLARMADKSIAAFEGGYIEDIEDFDVTMFGITPFEAKKMDPQQRILLKTTQEMLWNAGLEKASVAGSNTGVFIGISSHDYSMILTEEQQDIYASTGNAASIAANRLSYYYDFHGPSMAIDTACSSSLAALHLAANALKNEDCDMAVCGGVNLLLKGNISKAFQDANMLSKESRCKTFDDAADGYVRGEGCGTVLLKRLSDAKRDGNQILAVVKASALNQDGKSNGLTAPNGKAQKAVISKAIRRANLDFSDIDYIEAHGTGTKLGDPIELNAINELFQNSKKVDHICYIGSSKTNIGHLEAAAGIASLIKTVMMLHKNAIPPLVHFHKLNSYIKLDETKLQVASQENLMKREKQQRLQYAGISSFGFGGTNCHVILGKYEEPQGDKRILDAQMDKKESYWIDTDASSKECNEMSDSALLTEMKKQTSLLQKQVTLLEKLQGCEKTIQVGRGKDLTQPVKTANYTQTETLQFVIQTLADITAYPIQAINKQDKLILDLGIDSIMFSKLLDAICAAYEIGEDVMKEMISTCYAETTTVEMLCNMLSDYIGETGQNIIEETQTIEQIAEQEDIHPESEKNVKTETSILDFEEYQSIHTRLENQKLNPYYKVSLGMPRDLITLQDNQKINFSTYNYVGLNGNPEVMEASISAIKKYGTSVSGSRMISGEILLHRELEEEISDFLGTEDTIAYIGGYTTNVSAISTIVGKGDLILHDALAHNSIITGCILSGAKRMSFKHNDVAALEEALKRVRTYYRRILIVVEGIYSMDGDICKLPEMIALKKQYGAFLMVDEAHSLGTIGDCGRGVGSYYHVNRKDVDLWMGTMSKSLASCGGYISGSKELIELLKYTSDGFMFSVGLSPANAASALAAIRILRKRPELVTNLRKNSDDFLQTAKQAGLDTGLSQESAIVPCILGDSKKCMDVSTKLLGKGINVMPIVYPAVAENEARLRFFISTMHTDEQIRYTVDMLRRVVTEE